MQEIDRHPALGTKNRNLYFGEMEIIKLSRGDLLLSLPELWCVDHIVSFLRAPFLECVHKVLGAVSVTIVPRDEPDSMRILSQPTEPTVVPDEVEQGHFEIGFTARALVQATLPHGKPPANVLEFSRTNGNLVVTIIAHHRYGLPYGTYPRILLAHVVTEAVRNKSPEVELGSSLRHFLSSIGISCRGGDRGSIRRVREHMQRLFSAQIHMTMRQEGSLQQRQFLPVEGLTTFWDPQNLDELPAWPSAIKLNQKFYEEVVARPVPFDLHALRVLSKAKSPLAIDIYQWLTHRFSYLSKRIAIPFVLLQEQFGSEYKRDRDFRSRFAKHMKLALELYPQATVEIKRDTLVLHPSRTHVPMRLVRGSSK